jgi:hypothetical protein
MRKRVVRAVIFLAIAAATALGAASAAGALDGSSSSTNEPSGIFWE